ncbi:uncharacterized protein LOC100678838 isoform X1 [Nasonia vitripennis]|uniref:Uncharacterized protein n=1 Tax=Nasonia vitripennis TaxID=7425 RepID=A0A7M7IS43_NASVI|nr:uncharacterized protein LOC100678838 isoform X1 [Nasonia vitripennis]
MARRQEYPLQVLLLLSFAVFAIVSSKTEPQQQQKPGAVVSELGTQSNSTSLRVIPSSSSYLASSEDSLEDDGGGDDDEDEAGGEEEEEEDEEDDDGPDEEEGEDEASLESSHDEDDDEYEDELRALVSTSMKPEAKTDKEVSELLEYKRRKKESQQHAAKDKRVPTVKKELSSQKEILLADNETQVQSSSSHPQKAEVVLVEPTAKESMKNELQETLPSYEEQREYSVVGPSELLRKQIKRQTALLNDLKAYLMDEYVTEREKLQELGAEEGLLAERLLKVLAENSGWRQFLTNVEANLNLSRQALETQKRLVQVANPFLQESTSTLTTSMPLSADDRPTRKPKKKKKKKKKLRHRNKPSTSATTTSITEATSSPLPPAVMATTETPWSSTQPSSAVKAKWRLVAERLFQQPWSQDDLREDESNVAKVRYSMPSKPRTLSPARRPLDDKERESLKALNSERQALMLKAAREYSQPRFVHFGKINTHQQTSSGEDLDDGAGYDANDRAYQRTHFGQLVSPSSSRLAYTRLREPMVPYPEQVPPVPPQYDVNFARNQEYLPPGRDFAASKPWQAGNPFRGGSNDGPSNKGLWNWRQFSSVSKPWMPWHSERDYFARLEQVEEETAKAWQQAQQRQQQQSWNRQNFRENLPPWLEEKEVQRMFHAQDSWPKPDKSRDYGMHRKEDASTWESSRNNNDNNNNDSQLKSVVDSKHEEESPKLTMKTWNSLTSDPATWPFKLPGAKPWPKDENGKSYNPNAELVRKLGLYSKNGRLRPDKDPLKELKQQKLQKSDKQGEPVQANDTRLWSGKVAPVTGSKWNEPDKQQQTWYNGMKIHENFEDDHNPHWNSEKLPADAWNLAKAAAANWGSGWPNKWKQFAYHKVTAQPTSKSGVTLDKPGKNAFIAVSAVSSPRYSNEWRKNDIEEIGQVGPLSASVDPNDPTSQMRMNVWKKSSSFNDTAVLDKTARIDVLENQLEDLKEEEGPVLLEVNVSIKNSTFHQTSTPSSSTSSTLREVSESSEKKTKDAPTPKEK